MECGRLVSDSRVNGQVPAILTMNGSFILTIRFVLPGNVATKFCGSMLLPHLKNYKLYVTLNMPYI